MKNMSNSNQYILGDHGDELDRLARQALFFQGPTENLLKSAGIGPGMRVLDLGCGVGDVSMIAGELVGRTGSVIGIDKSDAALNVGRARAISSGLHWVTFARQDIQDISHGDRFDAVVGRFILLHFADPTQIVLLAKTLLKPDGVLAFGEMDIRSAAVTPVIPLLETCLQWIVSLYERAGLEPDMGSKLYQSFCLAGLLPTLAASSRIEGGAASVGLGYVVDTLRSMLPMLLTFQIVTVDEIDIDTLGDRLKAEAAGGDHCIVYPRFVGAWARQ